MIAQTVQKLLSQPNNAIVAVNRPSGGPQVTPVWYLWDGQAFYFSTTTDRAKYSNIKRNPSISLIVDDVQGDEYVAVYGDAEIIEREDSNFVHLTTQIVEKYCSPAQVEQTLKRALGSNRILVKLQPEKMVGPHVNG